jgi:hypothetical protein
MSAVLETAADCPACDGAGEVGTNPTRNNDPQFDDAGDCGVCRGSGQRVFEEQDPAVHADEHMVTIPGRYDGPPIHLDPGVFFEIDLRVGSELVHPNALDLLEAVLKVAFAVNPGGVAEVLDGFTTADIETAILHCGTS